MTPRSPAPTRTYLRGRETLRGLIRLLIEDWWYSALPRVRRARRHLPSLVVTGGVLFAAAATWHWGGTLWRMMVPMARPGWDSSPADLRAQAEGQFRLFVVQATAAIGGVIALAYTSRNYRLSRRGQMTDRLVKALERLGSSEEYVRLGGVLALEQVAQDAPDQAHHIVQILHAFVRRHAPRAAAPATGGASEPEETSAEAGAPLPVEPPASDVQAALTLMTQPSLARRPRQISVDMENEVPGAADLRGLDLRGVNLEGAWLKGANLDGADLTAARLTSANLSLASIDYAQLHGASFDKANLTRAGLSFSDLTLASFDGADCTDAFFLRANLFGTSGPCHPCGGGLRGGQPGEGSPRRHRLDEVPEADSRAARCSEHDAIHTIPFGHR